MCAGAPCSLSGSFFCCHPLWKEWFTGAVWQWLMPVTLEFDILYMTNSMFWGIWKYYYVRTFLMLFTTCQKKQMLGLPYATTSAYQSLDVRLFLPEIFQYFLTIFSQINNLVLKTTGCLQFLKFSFSKVQKILNFSGIPGFSQPRQFSIHNSICWQIP